MLVQEKFKRPGSSYPKASLHLVHATVHLGYDQSGNPRFLPEIVASSQVLNLIVFQVTFQQWLIELLPVHGTSPLFLTSPS